MCSPVANCGVFLADTHFPSAVGYTAQFNRLYKSCDIRAGLISLWVDDSHKCLKCACRCMPAVLCKLVSIKGHLRTWYPLLFSKLLYSVFLFFCMCMCSNKKRRGYLCVCVCERRGGGLVAVFSLTLQSCSLHSICTEVHSVRCPHTRRLTS